MKHMVLAFLKADERISQYRAPGTTLVGPNRIPVASYVLMGTFRSIIFTWPHVHRFQETLEEQLKDLAAITDDLHALMLASLPLASIPKPENRFKMAIQYLNIIEKQSVNKLEDYQTWLGLLLNILNSYSAMLGIERINIAALQFHEDPIPWGDPLKLIQSSPDLRYQCAMAACIPDGQTYLTPPWDQLQNDQDPRPDTPWAHGQVSNLCLEWQHTLKRYCFC